MITPKESPSREVLEQIADDYRRRGYHVTVQPRGGALPDFLMEATPDLIARRGDENLVIEVKRSPKDVDPVQLNAIARLIAKEPGWRFLVLATNPQDQTLLGKQLTTLDEASIRRQLEEVDTLLAAGHLEAGFMLLWAAIEAILRLLVTRHGLPITRSDAATLIRELASEGYIGEDAFTQLNEGLRLRNAVAHGTGALNKESVSDMQVIARELMQLSKALLRELAAA